MQLRVLRFGFLQDGNVGVGVFPQRKKIFVGGERPNAGGIGIRALRGGVSAFFSVWARGVGRAMATAVFSAPDLASYKQKRRAKSLAPSSIVQEIVALVV